MNQRLTQVKAHLYKKNLDALLVSTVANITHLTGFSNFSESEREAYLLIMAQPQGLTHKTSGVFGYLLTDGRYIEAVKKQVRDFDIIEVSVINPLFEQLASITRKEKIKRLGFEKNNLTVGEFERFNDLNHFSKLISTENLVENLRVIKEPQEISAIEKACKLGDKTFDYILTKVKPGITEKKLAYELEFFIKKQGADISFPPIVAFGPNSSIPHHQTSNKQLATSELVLVDFGVKLDNYCSDMARVVFLGKATTKQKEIYETVLEAQKRVIDTLYNRLVHYTPSFRGGDVDRVARDYITSRSFLSIPHSLGHGIGLEVHELPRLSPKSNDKLVPGMVFSIEPGIYITNFGGVRIEDLVVLEPSGPRLLTHSSKNLIEI